MVLRWIARYLLNNENLIQKLSESYPIRRAAQWAVYWYTRGRMIGQNNKYFKDESTNVTERFQSFKERFNNELRKEWKDKSQRQ